MTTPISQAALDAQDEARRRNGQFGESTFTPAQAEVAAKLIKPADEDTAWYPREDWEYEVDNGDTDLGYDEWVEHKEVSDGFYGLDGLTPEQQLSEDRQAAEDAICETRKLVLEQYPTATTMILTNGNDGVGSPYLVALRIEDKDRNALAAPKFDASMSQEERNAAELLFEDKFASVTDVDRDMSRIDRLTVGYARESTWKLNLVAASADS